MNIQIMNSNWITVEKDKHGLILTFIGDNGNVCQIFNIKKNQQKEMLKEIEKFK